MKKGRQLPFERSSNFAYTIGFRQSFARHDDSQERKSFKLALPTVDQILYTAGKVLFLGTTTQPGYYGEGSVDLCRPYSSLYYLQRQASHPGIDTVANIISHSAPTHGNINALGLRGTIRVVEKKEVNQREGSHRDVFKQ